MARSFSIHVGVNKLSNHYNAALFGKLNSCIKDANDMANIARLKGFQESIVLPDAKIPEFETAVRSAAGELQADDICMITFSGHGAQKPDKNREENDDTPMDETWCFNDRQLLDEELLNLLTEFREKVRVLVISDSCHSGTIIDRLDFSLTNTNLFSLLDGGFDFGSLENMILRGNGLDFIELNDTSVKNNLTVLEKTKVMKFTLPLIGKSKFFREKNKSLPKKLIENVFDENKDVYDTARFEARRSLDRKLRDSREDNIRDLKRASILLISACQDWQTTKDGRTSTENSAFTKALIAIWNNGNFSGSYIDFHQAISDKLKAGGSRQTPNRYMTGKIVADFEKQKPFTVGFP